MKIAFLTLSCGDEFGRMAQLVNPAKSRYCARFGYDFLARDELLDTTRPAAWSKILAIQEVLGRYDWVFWCDTDAVLWNADVGLRQFIAAAGPADAIFQANPDGPNSGLFFIRTSPWSCEFLHEIYLQYQFIDHPWWENAAIMELAKRSDVRARLKIYPPRQPPGGFHGYRIHADWDKIFIHHAGIRGSARMVLIENLARLAEQPAQRRWLTRSELGPFLNRLGLLGEGAEVEWAPAASRRQFLTRGRGGDCT